MPDTLPSTMPTPSLSEALLQALPPSLHSLDWGVWLVISALLVLALLLGSVLGWLSRRIIKRFTSRNELSWSDNLQARIKTPLVALWSVLVFSLLLRVFSIQQSQLTLLEEINGALATAFFFWGLSRVVQSIASSRLVYQWAKENPEFGALLPLMLRASRVGILILALITIISSLGYPVTSLIAGLGIGGLALALAAQKTGENVFGSLAISLDHPFRVGDLIRTEGGVVGFIDMIGLRSTRIRTLEQNTIITIPNGKLSESQIEIVSHHGKTLFHYVINLLYETKEEQLRQVMRELDAALKQNKQILPDEVIVRFKDLSVYSLDIEIMACFTTNDWLEIKKIREDVLFQCMQIVAKAGASFAFPTQTLHVTGADRT